MTRTRIPVLFAALATSCVEEGSTQPPAGADASAHASADGVPAPQNAAASESSPLADAGKPDEPTPTALFVAMEGRCEHMNVSVVSGEPFVAYGGGGYRSSRGIRHDLIATRIADDGTVAEQLPSMSEREVAPELGVYSISGFSGRWPGQLYAELDVGYRDSSSNDLARLDANGWVAVDPFPKSKDEEYGGGPPLHRVHPWYDKSILAVGGADGWGETRFAVVRGKPKGPRLTKAKNGCKEPVVTAYDVVEAGDVVAGWTCKSTDKETSFVTHWPKGDLDGTTTRIDAGVVEVKHDGHGSFWVLLGDERSSKLLHGKGRDWETVQLPAKGVADRMAVDAEGMPWIVMGNRLHIRTAKGWTSEDLPGKGKVEELVGVELGTPWIRRGGTSGWELRSGATLHRRDADGWHDIAIPPSAFFAGKDVAIDHIAMAGPDDVWAEGHYFVRRHGKSGPARHYRVVLHSRAVAHPQRCGEVVDGPISSAFAKWPTAVNERCTTRMALLFREATWDDANDYPKLRKAIRGIDGLEGARLVQAEVGGEKFLAALVASDATAEALLAKARKLRPYKYPEVVCGDQAVLDAAGVVVHRELAPPKAE